MKPRARRQTAGAVSILSKAEAREFLTGHHGLKSFESRTGRSALPQLLEKLKCIQLDPLSAIGTNADLVALARVDGIRLGDIYDAVFPGRAFEHFAKERCLLPGSAFPWYRDRAAETPWWRLSERLKRLPRGILESVLNEIRERGPVSASDLHPRGKVSPIDWSGWKGTASASKMALEVLWTRCQVVVCGRKGSSKLYDIPERALPRIASRPSGNFERWALLNRIEAAGLLSESGGPMWSMLSEVRRSSLPAELLSEGALELVTVEGSSRRYFAPAGFRRRKFPRDDERLRILGPLDPFIWDRKLVQHIFDFDYVWEVYKPASERRWGWYVCPLFHRGRFVGRLEGRIENEVLKVMKLWREDGETLDEDALSSALERHATAAGASTVSRPRRIIVA